MNYSFKPTTHGRAVLAACMALSKAPDICRVAFGSGRVSESTNLADVHELLAYVAEGTIGDRSHSNDHFYFTIQYSNFFHPEIKTFYLSEFIVYIIDPVTGEETDLLYGTLGDYMLPVPQYHDGTPPSVFDLPLILVISDEISVKVSASPGLVTYKELQAHNSSEFAHDNILHDVPHYKVLTSRIRDPNKPDYGLGGGGEWQGALEVASYSGTAEVAVVLNNSEYDGKNISRDAENSPDGTMIIKEI